MSAEHDFQNRQHDAIVSSFAHNVRTLIAQPELMDNPSVGPHFVAAAREIVLEGVEFTNEEIYEKVVSIVRSWSDPE